MLTPGGVIALGMMSGRISSRNKSGPGQDKAAARLRGPQVDSQDKGGSSQQPAGGFVPPWALQEAKWVTAAQIRGYKP